MSYDDFMMSEEDSYEFEFEDDDDVMEEDKDNQNFDLENKYYKAKALKEEDTQLALSEFNSIIDAEQTEENIDWIFKSYKQMMKVNFKKLKNYTRALEIFEKLIILAPKVNKNYFEESLNKILANYSKCNDASFKSKLYDLNLNYLNESGNKNDRLWLKININRLNILLDTNQLDDCVLLINQVNEKLKSVSSTTRTTYSLEIVAVEIQYYSKTGEYSKLRDLYKKAVSINSAVPHPRIMGIVKEAAGKMFFRYENYNKSRIEFYESFKNYDEAGSESKITILKYLTLCSILTENEVNPFESKETQIYAQMPEFQNLVAMVDVFASNDLQGFYGIISQMEAENDPLVHDFIFQKSTNKIKYNLRSNILINLFASFKRMEFVFLEKKLNLAKSEIEDMILTLISKGKLSDVKLDLVNDFIVIGGKNSNINPIISSREIYANLRCLDNNITRDDISATNISSSSNMDKDVDTVMESPITSSSTEATNGKYSANVYNLNKMKAILNLHEKSPSTTDIFKAVDAWHKVVETGIPERVKSELSQKDQIALEQRTNVKLEDGDYDDVSKVDKLTTLTMWYNEIKDYQNSLVRK